MNTRYKSKKIVVFIILQFIEPKISISVCQFFLKKFFEFASTYFCLRSPKSLLYLKMKIEWNVFYFIVTGI